MTRCIQVGFEMDDTTTVEIEKVMDLPNLRTEATYAEYVAPLPDGCVIDGVRFRTPNWMEGWQGLMGDMFWYRNLFVVRDTPLFQVIDIETTELGGDITDVGIAFLRPRKGKTVAVAFIKDPDDRIPRPSEMFAVGAGWNLSYDLPLLNQRYRWGFVKKQNFRYGDKIEEIDILYSGDEWVDVMLLVKKWDVMVGGILRSYGLKEASRLWFPNHRRFHTFVEATEAAAVEEYLLDDLTDTAAVLIGHFPYWKVYADLLGVSYQTVATAGTGWSVENLLVQPYLYAGKPLPRKKEKSQSYQGAYVFAKRGVYPMAVYKWDYTSLYPSIFVIRHLVPENDRMEFLPHLIRMLRLWRIEAKKNKSPLSSSLKLLTNSAYGYLGSSFRFADVKMAKTITGVGRVMVRWLEMLLKLFGEVIEVDTDGVLVAMEHRPPVLTDVLNFLVEPYLVEEEAYEGAFVAAPKNYILRKRDGKGYVVKGNSLRSRKDGLLFRMLVEVFKKKVFEDGSPVDEGLAEYLFLVAYEVLQRHPETVANRQRMGKGIRRLKGASAELLSTPDGVWVEYYRSADGGWSKVGEGTPVDMRHYLAAVVDFIGRFGGELEDWSKRHKSLKAKDELCDRLGIPVRFSKTGVRRSVQGNLFAEATV